MPSLAGFVEKYVQIKISVGWIKHKNKRIFTKEIFVQRGWICSKVCVFYWDDVLVDY